MPEASNNLIMRTEMRIGRSLIHGCLTGIGMIASMEEVLMHIYVSGILQHLRVRTSAAQ